MSLLCYDNSQFEDFSRYKPECVDAYLENRTFGTQDTIEEWIENEGRFMFSNEDIYAPFSIGVRIMGSAANLFQFDIGQKDWCDSLTQAVKGMLVQNNLATGTSTVELVDIRGTPVASKPLNEVSDGGELLVMVDGKRLLDEPRLARQIGLPLETPVSHAPNKEALLDDHVYNLTAQIRDLVLEKLSEVDSMVDAEKMICNEDDPANLMKPIAELVKQANGHADSFEDLLSIHACQDAVQALRNKRITEDDFATDIAGAFLDEVARSMQANNMLMNDYFTAKQMENSNLFASVGASMDGKAGARTIFGSQVRTHTEKIGQMLQDYPSNRDMFQTIVDHALFNNQMLEHGISVIIKKGCNKHRRCNKRSLYRHGKKDKHRGSHGDLKHVHRHGAKLRDYKFEHPDHHKHMHQRAHRLMHLPPAPGTVVMENWHHGKAHDHGEMTNFHRGGKAHHNHQQSEGQMENYQGSFPHAGLHDTRYSQNTSVGQGRATNVVTEKERDARYKEEPYPEPKHVVGGVEGPKRFYAPRTKVRYSGGKGKEEEDEESEQEAEDMNNKIQAPAMIVHSAAPAPSNGPPALESVKSDVLSAKNSPDTVSVVVTRTPTVVVADAAPSKAVSLPPAVEVFKVTPTQPAPATVASLPGVSAVISKKDEELIRATLRSADAVMEGMTTRDPKKGGGGGGLKRDGVPVRNGKDANSPPTIVISTAKETLVRPEPPSMELFPKPMSVVEAAKQQQQQTGYKVHTRVAAEEDNRKKNIQSPPASATVKVVLPNLPVQKHVDDAIVTDDIDLDSFLIPQASSIRV